MVGAGLAHATQEDHSIEMHERINGRTSPRSGDVLVWRRSARADAYEIEVVARSTHTAASTYGEAIDKANYLARVLGVDAWFTCDHRHYARLASHLSG